MGVEPVVGFTGRVDAVGLAAQAGTVYGQSHRRADRTDMGVLQDQKGYPSGEYSMDPGKSIRVLLS